jgi:hypothetical protein
VRAARPPFPNMLSCRGAQLQMHRVNFTLTSVHIFAILIRCAYKRCMKSNGPIQEYQRVFTTQRKQIGVQDTATETFINVILVLICITNTECSAASY